MPCPMLLFNNHYYCYSFNEVIILLYLYNIFPGCKNNDNNVRKKLFLLSLSIFMRIYKHLKLLLFCKYIHLIEFYYRNNNKTNKQTHNLQTTIHGGG